jgi:hypothetical protein
LPVSFWFYFFQNPKNFLSPWTQTQKVRNRRKIWSVNVIRSLVSPLYFCYLRRFFRFKRKNCFDRIRRRHWFHITFKRADDIFFYKRLYKVTPDRDCLLGMRLESSLLSWEKIRWHERAHKRCSRNQKRMSLGHIFFDCRLRYKKLKRKKRGGRCELRHAHSRERETTKEPHTL